MLRLSLLAALPATLALVAPTAPRRQTSLRDYTLDDAPIGGPLEPVANYILVKIDDGIDATKGGVFLPDQAKEKPSAGIVVAAGAGKAHPDTGVVVPNPVTEGDRVLYGKFDGTSVKYCGEDHQLIKDDDILLSWAGDASMTLGEVKCVADNVLVQVTKVEEDKESSIATVLSPCA